MFDFTALLRDSEKIWAAIANDMPQCRKCHEMQVQIIDWWAKPMKWRCRMCFHKFEYQPQPPSDPANFWWRISGWVH